MRSRSLFLLALFALSLSACGQKGPLSHPPPPPAEEAPQGDTQ
ncbi:MAG TPA: lipoprotein [Gammaproteobacteria bacterium]|nr:lipoprotein [Gammaproteobacteria bacterium]